MLSKEEVTVEMGKGAGAQMADWVLEGAGVVKMARVGRRAKMASERQTGVGEAIPRDFVVDVAALLENVQFIL